MHNGGTGHPAFFISVSGRILDIKKAGAYPAGYPVHSFYETTFKYITWNKMDNRDHTMPQLREGGHSGKVELQATKFFVCESFR